MKCDDHVVSKSSLSPINNVCQNSSSSSRATSNKRTPVRDESVIVASEVEDSNCMSEERLKEAFELINASADRILDQIDKVGSFNNDDNDEDNYYTYGNETQRKHISQNSKLNYFFIIIFCSSYFIT